ncbi:MULTISPECIES: hypothetical protein [Brevibacillus]|jgi:hypothetical protein|uniref:hypothetical protein n=1 Tax=Brevibacillus TaxID=55080 RepID=UPI0004690EDC|nr:hypothetical protein [Brevibacillus borstelensis]KKX55267.1 hypothetical protein X546_11495 [Brevibacillus borstelensis cifa_chp40]MBE5396204.1 hypothetical protein [Brevibacillus borstelensis]MCC0563110.1 hypothetical protein [Brevibacillus borstelensis]MCM3469053.1 hypothetical protein [Brevibacillus borstelensis]MCM3558463.1 hypothetical protein [Brevibacillus borstelensis]
MRIRKMISGIGVICLLTACTNQATPNQGGQNQGAANQGAQTQSMHQQAAPGHDHTTVIPSVDRDKKLTTNQYGATNSGMGTATYSMMGSSGLNDGGPSSNLEARLAAAGVNGVNVLVVHDCVFLAPADGKTLSTNSMDETQNHLLSPYEGSSYRGPSRPTDKIGTMGASAQAQTLSKAKDQIERIYGGGVEIRTVTNPQAIAAMDRIKQATRPGKESANIGDDLALLFRSGSKQP